MKISFKIEYYTNFGQRIMIGGSIPQLGNWNIMKASNMNYTENGIWNIDIELSDNESISFEYNYYLIDDNNNSISIENLKNRTFNAKNLSKIIVVIDKWRNKNVELDVLCSKAFVGIVFKSDVKINKTKNKENKNGIKVKFQVIASRIDKNHIISIIGNIPQLGLWNEKDALILTNEEFPMWSNSIIITENTYIEYKYAIYDKKERKIIFLEKDSNRVLNVNTENDVIVNDNYFNYSLDNWKGAGVAIPIFSLRSKKSFGVGEFTDLKLLVDWSIKTNLKMIQILPINDTIATHKFTDSYPYAAISVFALNPIYLNIEEIEVINDKNARKTYNTDREKLNALSELDYEEVIKLKAKYIKIIYDQTKEKVFNQQEYKDFIEKNKEWLIPYAAFSYLRDKFNTYDYSKWIGFSKYDENKINNLCSKKSKEYDDIAIHYFQQYFLHLQLKSASEYAHKNGIVLKGDIPIGIYRYSVDAWMYPELYNLDSQAGAPPDDFSVVGQNWKFPTYKWEVMSEDNYSWWKKRFQQLSIYFDAFRIDHILGFFRIWEIPNTSVEGLLGYFNPSIPFHKNEIENKGLWFDFDRFCKPYIRRHFLEEFFGEFTQEAIPKYLDEFYPGCYNLKPQFANQILIENHFSNIHLKTKESILKNETIKKALFGLTSEVIFIELQNSNGQLFNPRIAFHNTKSYRELPIDIQNKLNELYIDYFYKRHENYWKEQGLKKLPALKNCTDMLVCGEDLGMVPDCVPYVMEEIGILSLEIQRMSKRPKDEFGLPYTYPYMSVCTTSSHDMSTIRGWWEENREKIQKYYNQVIGYYGEAPYFCEPNIVQEVIKQHLYSPSMWAIFPIQDLVGMDGKIRRQNPKEEQINDPSNPQHYWRYRFHINLEDLLKETNFNKMLKNLIELSGRSKIY